MGREDFDLRLLESRGESAGYTVAHASRPRVSYRHVKGTKVHSVKLEMDLDFSVDRVWAMGWEFELLDTWNPYSIEPTIVAASEGKGEEREAFTSSAAHSTWRSLHSSLSPCVLPSLLLSP